MLPTVSLAQGSFTQMLCQLIYQAIWELVILWVRNIPVEDKECKWIYEKSYIWTADIWSFIYSFALVSQVSHQAVTYPCFCNKYIYSPLDWSNSLTYVGHNFGQVTISTSVTFVETLHSWILVWRGGNRIRSHSFRDYLIIRFVLVYRWNENLCFE